MSTTAAKQRLSVEEYLAIEEAANRKSEFYDGEMFAMAGGSFAHSLIATNILAGLRDRLRGGPCRPLNSDLRVVVAKSGLYTYPDVSVVCGPPQFAASSATTLVNPSMIVEVLSPSTERYDRTAKFWHYEKIESLRDYLLVTQDEAFVQHFFRQAPGSQQPEQWFYAAYKGMEEILRLPSLKIELPLREVYEGVELSPPVEPPPEQPLSPGPPML